MVVWAFEDPARAATRILPREILLPLCIEDLQSTARGKRSPLLGATNSVSYLARDLCEREARPAGIQLLLQHAAQHYGNSEDHKELGKALVTNPALCTLALQLDTDKKTGKQLVYAFGQALRQAGIEQCAQRQEILQFLSDRLDDQSADVRHAAAKALAPAAKEPRVFSALCQRLANEIKLVEPEENQFSNEIKLFEPEENQFSEETKPIQVVEVLLSTLAVASKNDKALAAQVLLTVQPVLEGSESYGGGPHDFEIWALAALTPLIAGDRSLEDRLGKLLIERPCGEHHTVVTIALDSKVSAERLCSLLKIDELGSVSEDQRTLSPAIAFLWYATHSEKDFKLDDRARPVFEEVLSAASKSERVFTDLLRAAKGLGFGAAYSMELAKRLNTLVSADEKLAIAVIDFIESEYWDHDDVLVHASPFLQELLGTSLLTHKKALQQLLNLAGPQITGAAYFEVIFGAENSNFKCAVAVSCLKGSVNEPESQKRIAAKLKSSDSFIRAGALTAIPADASPSLVANVLRVKFHEWESCAKVNSTAFKDALSKLAGNPVNRAFLCESLTGLKSGEHFVEVIEALLPYVISDSPTRKKLAEVLQAIAVLHVRKAIAEPDNLSPFEKKLDEWWDNSMGFSRSLFELVETFAGQELLDEFNIRDTLRKFCVTPREDRVDFIGELVPACNRDPVIQTAILQALTLPERECQAGLGLFKQPNVFYWKSA